MSSWFTNILVSLLLTSSMSTPLEDYVHKKDDNFSFGFLKSLKGSNYIVYILNMTSQQWLTDQDTTQSLWWHFVSVVIPDVLNNTDTALLYLDSDNNDNSIPSMKNESLSAMTSLAVGTGSICAVLSQVPNQPIRFLNDPEKRQRYEDSITAWTWRQFLDGTDPEIILQFPMTKAVVRGMDTVSLFYQSLRSTKISKFVIAGQSQRGWVTWLTAAIDQRVVGIVPTVMDLLNVQQNLHHFFRSLGGWSFTYQDYYNLNMTADLDSPNSALLQAIIDPLTYFTRLTMPKLIVIASGDEFYTPDNSHYYFEKLVGPKFLRIIPNADHLLFGHSLTYFMNIKAFFLHIIDNVMPPNITWLMTTDDYSGNIVVSTSIPPKSVTVYQARTLDDGRRDFRLYKRNPNSSGKLPHPVLWFTSPATQKSPTVYQAKVERPVAGWVAFYLQLSFDSPRGSTLEVTTEINIVPDTFPFPDCSGQSCYGQLV